MCQVHGFRFCPTPDYLIAMRWATAARVASARAKTLSKRVSSMSMRPRARLQERER
jgi:hypothetical protein